MYWSTIKSNANISIWNASARGSFKLLFAKFHFNDPTSYFKILLWRKSNGLHQKTFIEVWFELAGVQTVHSKKHTWENTCLLPVERKQRRQCARYAARTIEKRIGYCAKNQCGPVHGLRYPHHTYLDETNELCCRMQNFLFLKIV